MIDEKGLDPGVADKIGDYVKLKGVSLFAWTADDGSSVLISLHMCRWSGTPADTGSGRCSYS